MSEACPNCQKPVLPTDVVCWHCGYTLPKRPKPGPPAQPVRGTPPGWPPATPPASEAGATDYDLRALLVYGLLTLAVIISLGLVMRSLSRQPTLVRSAPAFGGEWVSVTDEGLSFTLAFPSGWQWIDVAAREQSALLDQVVARQGYIDRALRPLGETAGDVTIAAVAVDATTLEDTEPKPFVIVGRSAVLRGLEPQAALDLLDAQPLPVTETAIDTRLAGQPQARFAFLDAGHAYQCRNLFVSDGGKAGYLVAACAPQAQYGLMLKDLDDILNSFQLLEY